LKKDRNWERFTEDEIKLLQSSYEQQGAERLAIRMGHSSRAVRMRASRLGLHRTSLVCAKFHPVTMPQTELAYLAGLIDGEGTVTFKARYKKPNPTPLFAITNTSLEMIEWIQERIPTPNTPVTEKPGLGRGFSKGSLLGHWTIQVRGMNYLPLYKALLPFLTVKRPQMEMLVEWIVRDNGAWPTITAHDPIYEFARIRNISRREVKDVPVFNVGTRSGTYEAAGYVVHNCGCPCIVTDFGVFTETILHGMTGYRCRTWDQFMWAAKNVDKINPYTCHDWCAANYSLDRVGKMYKEYFDSIMDLNGKAGWHTEHPERTQLDWLKMDHSMLGEHK
jgi:hypothetical protein